LITIVIALAILSVLGYLLFGGNPLRRNVTLRVVVDDSGGMQGGAPVRLNGIRIGKVDGVELAPNPSQTRVVEIRMSVEARQLPHIPEDSVVEIGAENLLGDKLIDITTGRSAAHIRAGGELRYAPPTDIDRAQVMASLEHNLRRIDALLSDIEAGRGSLARLLRDDSLYRVTAARLQQVERGVHNAGKAGLLGNLIHGDDEYQRFRAALARYDEMLAAVEEGRGAAGELLHSAARHDELVKSIASLRGQIAAVSRNRYLSSDRDYRQWNALVEKLIRAIETVQAGEGSLGQLLHTASAYESMNGAAHNLEAFLREFREHPGKFLRVDLDLF
jgi:phospholipid/cholesterol/gamma-HCH transport system substrate-binding protein